jgi:UrcA family protein
MKNLNLITLAAAATVATLNLTSAFAGSPEPRAVVVNFSDLDATKPQGAARLYARMKTAAEVVCSDLDPGRLMERMQPYAKCVQEALSHAVAEVDVPAVKQYASARKVPANGTRIQIARGN